MKLTILDPDKGNMGGLHVPFTTGAGRADFVESCCLYSKALDEEEPITVKGKKVQKSTYQEITGGVQGHIFRMRQQYTVEYYQASFWS